MKFNILYNVLVLCNLRCLCYPSPLIFLLPEAGPFFFLVCLDNMFSVLSLHTCCVI